MAAKVNIWAVGLFALIVLFYIGAFLQRTLAWAPFVVVLLLMIPRFEHLNFTKRDLYNIRWFLLLMAWAYASLLWSIEQEATINGLRNLVPKLAVVFFAYKFPIYQRKNVENLGIFILMIVSILALYFVVEYGAIRITAAEKAAYRISYANLIAAAIIAAVPLILFNRREGWWTASNLMLVIGVYVVVLTESRAGIILVGFAFALSLALGKAIRVSKWLVALIIAALLLAGGWILVQSHYPDVADRLSSVGDTLSVLSRDGTADLGQSEEDFVRKMQILYTIEEIKKFPIVGVGYGAFGAALERDTGVFVGAHSFFGTFFVELGVIGFVLFVAFNMSLFAALVRKGGDVRRPQEARVARMVLVALILANLLFLSRPQMSEVTYFVVLGFAMAAAAPGGARARCSRHGNKALLITPASEEAFCRKEVTSQ